MPALEQVSLELSDGTRLDFGSAGAGESGTLIPVAPIHAASFVRHPGASGMCPICIDGQPMHQEHVPQKNLGGEVMTMTCRSCNNDLGSRSEVDLQHWFDHALVDVTFDHDGLVPGRRRIPPLYYTTSEDGSFALFVDGPLTPAVRDMITSGEWRMNYRLPDPRRYRLALLKHAYLAACLHLGTVPDTATARSIRADLLAARDAPRSTRPPESEAANRLKVYRSDVGVQGPPLALVARPEGVAPTREPLISLAGALFVSWPSGIEGPP